MQSNNNNNNNKNNNNRNTRKRQRIAARARRRRLAIKRNNLTNPKIFRRRQAILRANGSIPMATNVSVQKYYNIKNLGETAVRIKGCDLIYKIPDTINQLANTSVMTIIPANPAYWLGTRISTVAQGYQNYRPVSMKIHYIPQCPVTQQGNVIGGTLWEQVPSADSLQQSLKTSNGGFLTQCYQPATSLIRMKSNLQYNLYRMAGEINQQSNPFIFIAIAVATKNSSNQMINPGYFFVEYDYILKNPIGNSTQFANSGLKTITDEDDFLANSICITCADFVINGVTFPVGTKLDIEYDATTDTYMYLYNNTSVDNPTIPVWIFENQPLSALGNALKNSEKVVINVTPEQPIEDNHFDLPPRTTAYMFNKNEPGTFIRAITNIVDVGTSILNYAYDFVAFAANQQSPTLGKIAPNQWNAQTLVTELDPRYYVLNFAQVKKNKKRENINKESKSQPSKPELTANDKQSSRNQSKKKKIIIEEEDEKEMVQSPADSE